ncbi:MAG: heme biosynthesis protein HemY [Thioalkalispiraceae bacterium]|jgi:HemY protein
MKLLIYILSILFLAVIAGLLAEQDPGYVLMGRGYQTMELSLSLFISLQILLFAALYFLIRFVSRTWHMPERIRRWRQHARSKKALAASRKGLIELGQGRWKQAERALTRHIADSEIPLLNYLSAARAAQKLNAPERRDHYLAMAHKSMPDADMAVELTQAELQIAHGQLEHALATLVHLHSIAPRHTHVLLLLARLYEQLGSWGDIENLLPDLKKYKVMEQHEYQRLSIRVYHALLDIAAASKKPQQLHAVWQRMPSKLRERREMIVDYVKHLIALDEQETCEPLLRDAIKHEWDNQLVHLYGLVRSAAPEKQLAHAENWLKGRESNPELLLTLGRLSINNKLWGKAQAYFESSLGYMPKAETYKELGSLLEQLDEKQQAADCFKKGLMLAMREND